jgi:hypothetical protein
MSSSSSNCASSMHQPQRWRRRQQFFAVCTLFAILMLPSTTAFSSLSMAAYKPPVKSSVSKIRNNRYSSSSTETVHHNRAQSRSPTQKSAYAGALNPPTRSSRQSRSFESRMRDLVLGTPKPKTKAPPAEGARTLPSNVFTVETLEDYKKVVGDEKEKLVAVRFHAPWCRVRWPLLRLYLILPTMPSMPN